MAEKELREKVLTYRILEVRLKGLLDQRKLLVDKLAEIQLTQNSLKEIKAETPVLIPLGAEAHAFGKIADSSKVIVEIGAGVALEKRIEEANELLEKRKEEIVGMISQVENSIAEISKSLEKLAPELKELVEKAG